MDKERLLRILRIFFQGLRLITSGLKKEIDGLERELNEPTDTAKAEPDRV
jgi:hypothetical protein